VVDVDPGVAEKGVVVGAGLVTGLVLGVVGAA
jgi:hypothetical protein